MDFEPTAEQKEFSERARRFAQEVIRPRPVVDEAEMVSAEIIRQLGELQMMSAAVPPECGGGGKGHVGYVLALMEISKACASLGAAVFVNNSLYCHSLLEFEKKDQRSKYLRPCASGEGIGSVTRNHPISDPNQVRIKALWVGSGWTLSGDEDLLCNGVLPSHCILPAKTGEAGINLFVLDLRNTSVLRPVSKEGLDRTETIELHLENFAVDGDGLLGEQGQGLKYLNTTRLKNCIGLAAHSVGIGRGFLDAALDFSLKRGPTGKTVFASQAVQWKLADTAMELTAAELLTLKAAWLADRSKPYEKEAAMAKLYGSNAAMKAALETAQILGEEGFDRANPFWEMMRRAKKCQIEQESNLRIKGVITGHLVRDLKGSI